MNRLVYLLLIFVFLTMPCGMTSLANATVEESESNLGEVPDIVTGDIKEQIEKHIANEVEAGNGFFRFSYEDEELSLNLVRVHVEYLASLSPTNHFACVDMVGDDGEFYDVDFFMEGPKGDMTVTETTVHKINGQSLYLWEQAEDKTWGRVPVDEASSELLGVVHDNDSFTFRYEVTLPAIEKEARMWIPLAKSDAFQTVTLKSITEPTTHEVLVDSTEGNNILFFNLAAADSGKKVIVEYDVDRKEKGSYASDPVDAKQYLEVPDDVDSIDLINATAEELVSGHEGELMKARALYDFVMDSMAYKKADGGWGQADVSYACNALSGNCTDYHAYFVALARAANIPARFAIGASIPSGRDEGGVDGYHCWAEFYADGKWWPVDISEADKFTSLSMYYFGHHPANRIELSRGRNLIVEPSPKSGPINFLAYPVLEVDGEAQKAKKFFSFKRK